MKVFSAPALGDNPPRIVDLRPFRLRWASCARTVAPAPSGAGGLGGAGGFGALDVI